MILNYLRRAHLAAKATKSYVSYYAMGIKTFVFLDLETTGLPFEENNRTKITELCLVVVQSSHLELGVFPRVQSKLNLCFNPRKLISYTAEKLTGLSNHLLEYQPEFGKETVNTLSCFLNLQPKPICFVAHNGNRFDYPILRAAINNLGELSEDILCIDSLAAFRKLHLQEEASSVSASSSTSVEIDLGLNEKVPIEFQDGYDELLIQLADDVEKDLNRKELSVEGVQKLNETTPPVSMVAMTDFVIRNYEPPRKSRKNMKILCKKQLFPGTSFKLTEVYQRLTKKLPDDAHKAECDVNMLIECAATLGEKFTNYANENATRFCDIPMMEIGRKLGS